MTSTLDPQALDLQNLNTLRLQSRAQAALRITDVAQVPPLAALAHRPAGLFVLGGGSNVVLPETLASVVAVMALRGVQAQADGTGHVVVHAAAGECWHELVAWCVARGLGGLENLALIPGTVGAAPVQNIGAYGVEVGEYVQSVTAYDLQAGRWVTFNQSQCEFAYRESVFKRHPGRWVITQVSFTLPERWQPRLDYPDLRRYPDLAAEPTPMAIFNAVTEIRRAKLPDPQVLPNAGSFFKNPVVSAASHASLAAAHPEMPAWPLAAGAQIKLAAGWLIEQCGWKGGRLGPVGMHERHALVLVNYGDAVAGDVARLAAAIQQDVWREFGVRLEQEPVAPDSQPQHLPHIV